MLRVRRTEGSSRNLTAEQSTSDGSRVRESDNQRDNGGGTRGQVAIAAAKYQRTVDSSSRWEGGEGVVAVGERAKVVQGRMLVG